MREIFCRPDGSLISGIKAPDPKGRGVSREFWDSLHQWGLFEKLGAGDFLRAVAVREFTKVFVVQGGSLDSYYEQTLKYLHQKYHTYPTNLLDLHIDPDVMAEVGMWERLAQLIVDDYDFSANPLPDGAIVA